MGILRRFFTLSTVALLAGLIGVGVGVLVAPATGSDTRTWLASLVDEHGPTVRQNMRKAGDSVSSAIDFVASKVDTETDGN
jgi:gas vesicle protein